MADLILWKNREISKLRSDLDRLFDRLRSEFGLPALDGPAGLFPAIDLSETDDAVILRAELAGIEPEDLEVSVFQDRLTIRGSRRRESVQDSPPYSRLTRSVGTFSRTIRLPCRVKVDNARARYRQGVLDIVLPKSERERSCAVKVKVQ